MKETKTETKRDKQKKRKNEVDNTNLSFFSPSIDLIASMEQIAEESIRKTGIFHSGRKLYSNFMRSQRYFFFFVFRYVCLFVFALELNHNSMLHRFWLKMRKKILSNYKKVF